MRQLNDVRARRAMAGMGALLMTTMILPGVTASAQTETEAPAAPKATKASAALTVQRVTRHVVAGRKVRVAGVLRPGGANRSVSLQVRAGHGWATVDRDRTGANGAYRLTWRTAKPGSRQLRVRFAGTAELRATRRSLGRANVYRRAFASWYGPGLYGGHLACGGRLTPGTLGVAHKTLPCGTRVTLRHRGHSVRVRVIDRGPFVGGREFDLTAATKQRLRFGSTGTVLTTR
jgi:rare lipoprotein A (peptidoglycan hydrolase)